MRSLRLIPYAQSVFRIANRQIANNLDGVFNAESKAYWKGQFVLLETLKVLGVLHKKLCWNKPYKM